MADRTIKVLTKADPTDLLTLDEAKLWLNVPLTDTSQDAVLESMISMFSEEIAEKLNRHPTVTVGKEEVIETWRETMSGRLFLSHWPVKEEDIISVTIGDAEVIPMSLARRGARFGPDEVILSPRAVSAAAGDYELEEASGKLSNIRIGGSQAVGWNHPVTVHYSGGYSLPDEAPKPLKHAVVMLIREEKIRMMQAQNAGIRQISHKESRVSFFDPNALLLRAVGMKSPTMQAVENILSHYMRFEV
jgi:hypothetical protein